jgi:hypothetical protein
MKKDKKKFGRSHVNKGISQKGKQGTNPKKRKRRSRKTMINETTRRRERNPI